jgi:excisionase family DNA binding protein
MAKDTKITITESQLENIIQRCLRRSNSSEEVTQTSQDDLMTISQICDFLNISKSTLHNYINKGLPSLALNGKRYFSKSDIIKYMRSQK